MDERQRVEVLAGCALFKALPQAALQQLAAHTAIRNCRRGQILFAEGDPGDSLIVVVSGSLKAYSTTEHGDEFLLAVVGPGETLGELALADGGLRSATVSALTEASVLRVPRDAVLELARSEAGLMDALMLALASVIRRLNGHAADLAFLDLPRRVGKLLLTQHGAAPDAAAGATLTQNEMAARVGASRQSVNAALQEFQRRGWIRLAGREITVLDPAALARFVGA
jgi:CRP/FNR family transcriptional regulator, cyclic AMP receptor protein